MGAAVGRSGGASFAFVTSGATGGTPLQLPTSGTLQVLLLRPPSSHQQHTHSRTQVGTCTQGRTRPGCTAGGSKAPGAGAGGGVGGPACAVLLLHEQPLCGAALLQLPSAPWGGGVGQQGWTAPAGGAGPGGMLGIAQASGSPFRLPVRFLFTCRGGGGGEDEGGGAAGPVAGQELEAWLREVWMVPEEQGQGQGPTAGPSGLGTGRPQGHGMGQGHRRLHASGSVRLCGGRAMATWSAQVGPSGAGGGPAQQQHGRGPGQQRRASVQGVVAADQGAAGGQQQGQGGDVGGAACVLAHPQRLDVRLELVGDRPELLASLQGALLAALGEGRGQGGGGGAAGGGRSAAGGAAVQSGEKLHEAIRELRRLTVAVQQVRVELEQHQHRISRLPQVACLPKEHNEGTGGQGVGMEMGADDVGRVGGRDGDEGAAEGVWGTCERDASLLRRVELRRQLQRLHTAYSAVAASSLMLAV